MISYIEGTKYASENLLKIIWEDHNKLTDIKSQVLQVKALLPTIEKLEKVAKQSRFIVSLEKEGIPEDKYDKLMNDLSILADPSLTESLTNKINEMNEQLSSLENEIKSKQFSLNVLSSSLLQIAKQGIFLAGNRSANPSIILHGENCNLRDTIRHFRNHSQHYEDGVRDGTLTFFEYLKDRKGCYPDFNDKLTNYSFEFIKDLNWITYDDYENNMKKFT